MLLDALGYGLALRVYEQVPLQQVAMGMQQFYGDPRLQVDMEDKSSQGYQEWALRRWETLAKNNPVKFLAQSSDFFWFDEINRIFHIKESIVDKQSPILLAHMQDILFYRSRQKLARLYKEREDDH